MDISKLNKLSNLVTMQTNKKPKIMLDPKNISRIITSNHLQNIDINVNIDDDVWTLTPEIKGFIEDLNESTELSVEDKIIHIYQELCMNYTYDDNVLSYIKKYDEDQFGLPDFYGRDTDEKWKQNRSKHNRRNCFEISRILAKAIITMLKGSDAEDLFETCILWDEALTHYYVGLISDEYCLTLDLDDFEEIKDLTRVKTDLTIKGIKILEDPTKKFEKVLNKFNSKKSKSSIEHIRKMDLSKHDNSMDNEEIESIYSDDLQFIKYALEILIEQYKLDSAGIFEYMKEIVDTKIGPASRKKVWTEVKETPGEGKRYTRCLAVKIGKQLYIIDVTADGVDQMFHTIDKSDISEDQDTGRYLKYLHRDWDDKYDGR